MDETTTLLFGPDGYGVLDVHDIGDDAVRVVIEPVAAEGACPACGMPTSRVKDRTLRRVEDLPACGRRVELWCRQRRPACLEPACPRKSFTQNTAQIPARARTTARLRAGMAVAIARSNRPVSDVAAEHEVSWGCAHRALIAHAAGWLPAPEPTRVLGVWVSPPPRRCRGGGETRARSVRWLREEAGWTRSDPWMTSFVNADPFVPGRLLGLVPGRSGACVKGWLALQDQAFRDGIEVAVIDPSAPYASGIRAALPNAEIAVDPWHLIKLGWGSPRLRGRHGHRGAAACVAGAARPPGPEGRSGVGAPADAADRRRPALTPPAGTTGAGARRG
jgi:transposase